MEKALTALLNQEERVIGGQLELHQGLSIHRGRIDAIRFVPSSYLHFTLGWFAHLNGSESNPNWIMLPPGKDFGRSYMLNLNCAHIKTGEHNHHFEVWDSSECDGLPTCYGFIHLKDSPHGLIDPQNIRGLQPELQAR